VPVEEPSTASKTDMAPSITSSARASQHRPYREAKRFCSLELRGLNRFENGPARCARHSG
jgi:hypothetical protein